jgi:hypothetical protein
MIADLEAGVGHTFAKAAIGEEVFLQAGKLSVHESVGLVDEADGNVRKDGGRTGVEDNAVEFESLRGFAAEASDVEGLAGVFVPNGKVAGAKVVEIVVEEFLQAGAGDAGELDLGLFGSAPGFAAFENILFARTSGLDHLVDGTVAFPEEFVSEPEGEVVDDFGLLEGEEGARVSARRDNAAWELGRM